jgi:hypothetical protein
MRLNLQPLYILFFLIVNAFHLSAQTGIGTTTPNASARLEIAATDRGFLPPRVALTAANTFAPIIGTAASAVGLLIYNTATSGTAPNNVTPGYYYWNGSSWAAMPSSQNSIGDVKTGMQVNDHNGWVKLDGRLKSSLTASQQLQANLLGFGDNLPNANNAFLVQNGAALGSVAGSNTKTILQTNLPNVSFNGTAATVGDHSHSVDPPNTATEWNGNHSHSIGRRANPDNAAHDPGDNRRWENSAATTDRTYFGEFQTSVAGNHNHVVDIAPFNSSNSGSHSHTVSVSSGGSGAALDVTPRSLSVNTFIYLGF